jgi:patatin-like phospholipase/acyl hydrolase
MKILSIDGGGIKGLFSAAFLAALEERFSRQVGDCFDLIAGTSTGGILALALAARIPAKHVVDFYKEWGPKIFVPKFRGFQFIKKARFSKYGEENLKSAVQKVFEKRKMKDVYATKNPVALCIPSINAITGAPWVFKTPHNTKLGRDNEYYLWEVAMATSAAPIYFPLARINIPGSSASNIFVDGGLWANNPSEVALTEALTYLKTKLEDIYLYSLGNIRSNTTFSSDTIAQKGILLWREKVVNLTLETQAFAIHNQMRLLFESFGLSSHYTRIEHEITSETHQHLKELDCTTEANLNDLEVYGRNRADLEGVKIKTIKIFKTGDLRNG